MSTRLPCELNYFKTNFPRAKFSKNDHALQECKGGDTSYRISESDTCPRVLPRLTILEGVMGTTNSLLLFTFTLRRSGFDDRALSCGFGVPEVFRVLTSVPFLNDKGLFSGISEQIDLTSLGRT